MLAMGSLPFGAYATRELVIEYTRGCTMSVNGLNVYCTKTVLKRTNEPRYEPRVITLRSWGGLRGELVDLNICATVILGDPVARDEPFVVSRRSSMLGAKLF